MKNPQILLVIALLLAWTGCKEPGANSADTPPPKSTGLFSPVQLRPGKTEIHVQDYFPFGDWPDEILGHPDLNIETDKAGGILRVSPKNDHSSWLSVLRLRFGKQVYGILLKRSQKVRQTFRFGAGDQTYRSVQLAGQMNDWNPAAHPLKKQPDSSWKAELVLAPGRYQYQYVANGNWMLDPANPVQVDNNIGGFNSEIEVKGTEGQVGGSETALFAEYDRASQKLFVRCPEWPGRALAGAAPVHLIAFWENQIVRDDSISLSAIKSDRPKENAIKIPSAASDIRRSHLRIFASAENGYVNDVLIPLEYGKPLLDPAQLTETDQHANILYFLMVDRFHSGNKANDAPLQDTRVHPKANYHGGDLAGILAKLRSGYFDSLGINMLWLSPIVRNPLGAYQEWPEPRRYYSGYHGYWPVASREIDPRFGTAEELKALIAEAKQRGIRLILDFVANHVHAEHPMMQAHPDWKTELYLADSTLNVRIWDAQRLTTWFDTFLPSLDFSKTEVIETQVDHALWWVKEFGLAGFRHDATKHIPLPFWRRLTQKLKTDYILAENKPLFQIGETFGSRELIGSYVGTGMLDGQFDFNQYFDLRGALCQADIRGEQLAEIMQASLRAYGHHSLMGNITGNHDMARFISYAGRALSFEESPQEAGWAREVEVGKDEGYAKLSLLTAYLMATPGIPVIYYGDEIGMPGGGDPDNRRDMRFSGLSDQEAALLDFTTKLIRIRRNNLPCIYGQTWVDTSNTGGGKLTIVRKYLGEFAVFCFNFSTQRQVFYLHQKVNHPMGSGRLHFGSDVQVLQGSGARNITVAPLSVEVVTEK